MSTSGIPALVLVPYGLLSFSKSEDMICSWSWTWRAIWRLWKLEEGRGSTLGKARPPRRSFWVVLYASPLMSMGFSVWLHSSNPLVYSWWLPLHSVEQTDQWMPLRFAGRAVTNFSLLRRAFSTIWKDRLRLKTIYKQYFSRLSVVVMEHHLK